MVSAVLLSLAECACMHAVEFFNHALHPMSCHSLLSVAPLPPMHTGVCGNAALEAHVSQLQTIMFKEATARIQAFQQQLQSQAAPQPGANSTGGTPLPPVAESPGSGNQHLSTAGSGRLVRKDSSMSSHGSGHISSTPTAGTHRSKPPHTSSRMSGTSPAPLTTPPIQEVRRPSAQYSGDPWQQQAEYPGAPQDASHHSYHPSQVQATPQRAPPSSTQHPARAQWQSSTPAASKKHELARLAQQQLQQLQRGGDSPTGAASHGPSTTHSARGSYSYSPVPDSGSHTAPRDQQLQQPGTAPHPAATFATHVPTSTGAFSRTPLNPQHLAILQQAAGYGPQGADDGMETAASLVTFGRNSLTQAGLTFGRTSRPRRSLSRGEERLYLSAINVLQADHRRRTGDAVAPTQTTTGTAITRATIFEGARAKESWGCSRRVSDLLGRTVAQQLVCLLLFACRCQHACMQHPACPWRQPVAWSSLTLIRLPVRELCLPHDRKCHSHQNIRAGSPQAT